MRRLINAALIFLFIGFSLVFAMDELRWGGQGYDPALKNSSRFVARPDIYNKNENLIEIWVDSKETVNEVGEMQLLSCDKQETSSIRCWKAMKHITAPYACSFHIEDIKHLSGQGKIIVKNRAGDTLIKDNVDLEKLSSFVAKIKKLRSGKARTSGLFLTKFQWLGKFYTFLHHEKGQ